MSTALNISILYIGTVRMGCLLFFFLSCKTSTWANINPTCTINRFNTSLEKKCMYSKFCFLLSLLFCFLFFFVIFEGTHKTSYNGFIKVTERWLMCLCPIQNTQYAEDTQNLSLASLPLMLQEIFFKCSRNEYNRNQDLLGSCKIPCGADISCSGTFTR